MANYIWILSEDTAPDRIDVDQVEQEARSISEKNGAANFKGATITDLIPFLAAEIRFFRHLVTTDAIRCYISPSTEALVHCFGSIKKSTATATSKLSGHDGKTGDDVLVEEEEGLSKGQWLKEFGVVLGPMTLLRHINTTEESPLYIDHRLRYKERQMAFNRWCSDLYAHHVVGNKCPLDCFFRITELRNMMIGASRAELLLYVLRRNCDVFKGIHANENARHFIVPFLSAAITSLHEKYPSTRAHLHALAADWLGGHFPYGLVDFTVRYHDQVLTVFKIDKGPSHAGFSDSIVQNVSQMRVALARLIALKRRVIAHSLSQPKDKTAAADTSGGDLSTKDANEEPDELAGGVFSLRERPSNQPCMYGITTDANRWCFSRWVNTIDNPTIERSVLYLDFYNDHTLDQKATAVANCFTSLLEALLLYWHPYIKKAVDNALI